MRGSIQAKITAGFFGALAILAIAGGLTYRATAQLIEDNRWVSHTFEVLATLEATRAALGDAEIVQRDYIITGDEGLLASPRTEADQVLGHLRILKELTADNPSQQRRIARFEPVIAARFALMRRVNTLRQSRGLKAAGDLEVRGRGQELRNEIRKDLEAMTAEERRLLVRRVDESRVSARNAFLTCSALILLALVLLALVFQIVRLDLARNERVSEALRRSQERFELAVLGSRDGLWDWDLATDTVFFSPRWKAQLGCDDHEIGHSFEEWEARVHPEDRDRALAAVAAYLEGRVPDFELEHRLRHKDGSYRWILTRGVALHDRLGKPYRMAGSHTDITARKEVECQLAEQNRLLEEAARSERTAHGALKETQSRMVQTEKLAGLGQMVAGVAHEINNPLAFVINNVAVLQRDVGSLRELLALYGEADEVVARDRPELLDRIRDLAGHADLAYVQENLPGLLHRTREGLRRIEQIVRDLRDFARMDEGGITPADLNAGIESTATIIGGHARKKRVALELDLHPLPPVACAPAKINQVVMNLLANGIDACDEGGQVTVRSRSEPGGVRIEVADTGSGIDPSVRGRIFDPFFTTKPVGQGTGLGLSISYGIVRDHGGTIEVESAPGRGTCFTVRLPLRPPPAGDRPLQSERGG